MFICVSYVSFDAISVPIVASIAHLREQLVSYVLILLKETDSIIKLYSLCSLREVFKRAIIPVVRAFGRDIQRGERLKKQLMAFASVKRKQLALFY